MYLFFLLTAEWVKGMGSRQQAGRNKEANRQQETRGGECWSMDDGTIISEANRFAVVYNHGFD